MANINLIPHTVTATGGGGASNFTQTYSGNTGIYFKNGIHATVDSHIKLFITTF